MITHLLIDYLEAGQLPFYDVGEEAHLVRYLGDVTPTTAGTWEQALARPGCRLMVNTTIDISLAQLEERLRPKLAELGDRAGSVMFIVQHTYNLSASMQAGMTVVSNASTTPTPLVVPGATVESITVTSNSSAAATDVFTITNAYPVDSEVPQGTWVLAGLAFVEGAEWGTPLQEGEDVVSIILEACHAFLEPHEPELHDAVAAAALRYHDPGNPRHQHPQGEPMTNEAIAEALFRRRQKREKAERVLEKAKKLLMSCLTPLQLREFKDHGEFHVLGKDGFHYLIEERFGHNVFRVEEGERTWKFCLVTKEWSIPRFDLMLAQKLLLENDPEAFLEKANSWRLD